MSRVPAVVVPRFALGKQVFLYLVVLLPSPGMHIFCQRRVVHQTAGHDRWC